MAWRFVSTSATADDMVDSLLVKDRTTPFPTGLDLVVEATAKTAFFLPQYGVQQRSGDSEDACLPDTDGDKRPMDRSSSSFL